MAKNTIEFGRLNQKMGRKKPPRYPDDPAPRPQPKIPNRAGPRKKPAPTYTAPPKSTAEKILTGNPFNSKQIGTVLKGAAGVAKRIDSGKKVVDRAIMSGAKNATKFVLGSATRGNGMAKKAIRSIDDPTKYLTPSKRTPQKSKPNGGRTEYTLERKYRIPRKPAPRQTLPSRPPSKDGKPAPRQTLEYRMPRKPRDPNRPRPVPMPRMPRKPRDPNRPRPVPMPNGPKRKGDGPYAVPPSRRPRPSKDGRKTGPAVTTKPYKRPKNGSKTGPQKLPAYPKDRKPKTTTLPYKPKPRKKTLY